MKKKRKKKSAIVGKEGRDERKKIVLTILRLREARCSLCLRILQIPGDDPSLRVLRPQVQESSRVCYLHPKLEGLLLLILGKTLQLLVRVQEGLTGRMRESRLPGRDLMTPPQLTRDAPITDLSEPVRPFLLPLLWEDRQLTVCRGNGTKSNTKMGKQRIETS